MKRIRLLLTLILVIFCMHHATLLLHEWMHGTIAWLTGYKSSPFDIHYGTQWLTLLDIEEAVPYAQILADRKPNVMAAIAIAPMLMQVVLFFVGLKFLRSVSNRWAFACLYWFTFFELAEIYSYIPTRTFSSASDMFNFLYPTGLSPWLLFFPGTAIVLYGLYRMLIQEAPYAFRVLTITTKLGRGSFLFFSVLIFFGYYGGAGFTVPDELSHQISLLSWALIPVVTITLWLHKKIKA